MFGIGRDRWPKVGTLSQTGVSVLDGETRRCCYEKRRFENVARTFDSQITSTEAGAIFVTTFDFQVVVVVKIEFKSKPLASLSIGSLLEASHLGTQFVAKSLKANHSLNILVPK